MDEGVVGHENLERILVSEEGRVEVEDTEHFGTEDMERTGMAVVADVVLEVCPM